eukprot:CAMPEP_0117563038 /NCGR_PEP_ID=MMETSP0784-20121206/55284_1 /TAXON_ID=39447 /ORGANISM="" /LENGTH=137 /DNA_ID=CAMNT_0005360663 /DNA_START=229 /DNA_END=643 /DNA_ORIENTATION=+
MRFHNQYAGLQQLHAKYASKGFSVVAVPSNQFGAQEPGSDANIKQFGKSNFGVTFPVLSKCDVNGPQAHGMYTYMKSAVSGPVARAPWNPGLPEKDIQWNFSKFLVVNGVPIKRYSFDVTPEQIDEDVAKALGSAEL